MGAKFEIFDLIIPLPYRIITYINIGVWLWLLTLRISSKFGINVNLVLRFEHLNSQSFINNHEKLSVNVSIASVLSYIVFIVFHNDQNEAVSIFDFIPLFTIGYIFYLLLNPNNTGSARLLSTIKRILKGNISSDIRTNDILLSDTLTSYSKTLIDFSIYICHLISNKTCLPKNSASKIDRTCGTSILLDSFIGFLPNLIRLSQCFVEYSRTGNIMHGYNFVKYLSNFPIIVVGLLLKQNPSYLKLWVVVALINSSYTFFWDVTYDWDLNLFRQFLAQDATKRDSLRISLKYNVKTYYYLAIFIDFLLRFIWILKFLPVDEEASLIYQILSNLYTTELGLFILQSLEIFRRWIWVFIKLEVEYINDSKDIEMNNLR